jgi:hypothetical protein
MFYTYRVFILSQKWWPVGPAWTTEVFSWIMGLIASAFVWLDGDYFTFRARHDWMFYTTFITAAVVSRTQVR